MKFHHSVASWESFPGWKLFHSEKVSTHPSRDSLFYIYQRFPTGYLPEIPYWIFIRDSLLYILFISKLTKGGQKEHQKLIASLWPSNVHFSYTFLSKLHIFTEKEKCQWKSLLWCLGLNPLFERGCRWRISLTLQNLLSVWMGFKGSTLRKCWLSENNTQPVVGSLFQQSRLCWELGPPVQEWLKRK